MQWQNIRCLVISARTCGVVMLHKAELFKAFGVVDPCPQIQAPERLDDGGC